MAVRLAAAGRGRRDPPDESYRSFYREAGLEVVLVERPLARGDETISWVSETEIPPCAVYVLARAPASSAGSCKDSGRAV